MVVTEAYTHNYTKNYCIIHFKWVGYMVCKLALQMVLEKKNSTCTINSSVSFAHFCLSSEEHSRKKKYNHKTKHLIDTKRVHTPLIHGNFGIPTNLKTDAAGWYIMYSVCEYKRSMFMLAAFACRNLDPPFP